MAVFVQHSLNW